MRGQQIYGERRCVIPQFADRETLEATALQVGALLAPIAQYGHSTCSPGSPQSSIWVAFSDTFHMRDVCFWSFISPSSKGLGCARVFPEFIAVLASVKWSTVVS